MEAFERWFRMKSVSCAKGGGMGSDGVAVGKRQCLEACGEVAIEAVLEQISKCRCLLAIEANGVLWRGLGPWLGNMG